MKEFFGNLPTSLCITLLVGVVIALFKDLLNRREKKRERFIKECADLRDAFSPAVNFLKHGPSSQPLTDTAYYVLTAAFAEHRRACERFRPYLSWLKRRGFDRAWNDFLYPQGRREDCPELLVDYINDEEDVQEEKIRRLALANIARVLRYARAI